MKDGGPAFPCEHQAMSATRGMSLLDWFAGMAMNALLANDNHDLTHSEVASDSYGQAKAMLAERERRLKAANEA